MTLADRLTLAMRIKGITQATLGAGVGVSQTTIWKLTHGKTSSNRKLYEIADYLNVNLDWLVSGKGEMGNNHQKNQIEYVENIKKGLIIVKGEAILKTDGVFQINEHFKGSLRVYSDNPNVFALKIKGDSLFPRINSSEFVVIDPNIVPRSGDDVLVRTKDGYNMIRKLEFNRDCIYRFTSINSNYPPITLDEDKVEKVMLISAIVTSSIYLDGHNT